MQDPSNRDPLWEAIDACRPGHDDRSDPALAPLDDQLARSPELEVIYRRVQAFDRSVADAFDDVPVPEELEGRILDRLARARQEQPLTPAADATLAAVPPSEEAPSPATRSKGRVSRRWLWGGVAASAAAASLLAAVLIGSWQSPDEVAEALIHRAAIDQFQGDLGHAGQGDLLAETPPDRAYPFSPDVVRYRAIRWRWVEEFLGHRAVAYDIPLGGGKRATLYVTTSPQAQVPASPPLQAFNTGGKSVAAWKSGDTLYVLVFPDGAKTYGRLIRQTPIT